MARRFVTALDVQRLAGRELVVDPDTVVTPQALEAARAAGVTIRSAAGGWREPAPDRGPDAERAAHVLPQFPEPAADEALGGQGFIVVAVGRNRAGVLAEITAALRDLRGDVHAISQRVVEGYFHLVLTVEPPPEASFEELKARLQCLGGEDDYVVRVMHQRVFRFMHRV